MRFSLSLFCNEGETISLYLITCCYGNNACSITRSQNWRCYISIINAFTIKYKLIICFKKNVFCQRKKLKKRLFPLKILFNSFSLVFFTEVTVLNFILVLLFSKPLWRWDTGIGNFSWKFNLRSLFHSNSLVGIQAWWEVSPLQSEKLNSSNKEVWKKYVKNNLKNVYFYPIVPFAPNLNDVYYHCCQ